MNKFELLKVGDIVIVDDAVLGIKECPVKEIIGNKAITDYMIFNKRIYPNGDIYELGVIHPMYTRSIYKKQ